MTQSYYECCDLQYASIIFTAIYSAQNMVHSDESEAETRRDTPSNRSRNGGRQKRDGEKQRLRDIPQRDDTKQRDRVERERERLSGRHR